MVYPDGQVFSMLSRKFLTPRWDGHYFQYNVRFNGKRHNVRAGVMVLETFTGPRPPGKICRHIDGNSKNNVHSNLEWSTQLINIRDTYNHGTRVMGETCGTAKLTESDIREIRSMRCVAASQKFNISRGQASRIINRLNWSHLD
jgi:hypothetical protein